MRGIGTVGFSLAIAALLGGCASSDVAGQRSHVANEYLERPGRVIVYDFAASPSDIPAGAPIAGRVHQRAKPQSYEAVARGRNLGALVARELVEDILEMGMPAERADGGPPPQLGDHVIQGVFVALDEGSRLKRMVVGFGAGAAEMKTFAEAYLVTEDGLRPLGSAEIEAEGGKMPGMLVPVAGGAAAGRVVTSAVVSGALNVAQEAGPESLEAAAERTAEDISDILRNAYTKRGWIGG